jgi:predicted regulator of Ras-like GTPase activity (Roadblock/LC7/MglB family)
VLLIDKAGQLISFQGSMDQEKVASLAALTAANYGATTAIARLFGEEEFTLLFHKGKEENIHFSNVGEEYLMITVFNNNTHLGLVRARSSQRSGADRGYVCGKSATVVQHLSLKSNRLTG